MIAKLKRAGLKVEEVWEDPREDVDDAIVRVTGHGIDETVYTHDEETMQRILDDVKAAKADADAGAEPSA